MTNLVYQIMVMSRFNIKPEGKVSQSRNSIVELLKIAIGLIVN